MIFHSVTNGCHHHHCPDADMGGIRRLINTPMRQYIMTEEQLKAMAEEYAAEYVPMYQKVAGIAFVDGMKKAMEIIKNKLIEL